MPALPEARHFPLDSFVAYSYSPELNVALCGDLSADQGDGRNAAFGSLMPGTSGRFSATNRGGRPKGSKSKKSQEPAELRRRFVARVAREWDSLIEAQIESARGRWTFLVRQSDGTFTRTNDPKTIDRALQSGKDFWRICLGDPVPSILKDTMDRVMGVPTAVQAANGNGKAGTRVLQIILSDDGRTDSISAASSST